MLPVEFKGFELFHLGTKITIWLFGNNRIDFRELEYGHCDNMQTGLFSRADTPSLVKVLRSFCEQPE